MLLSSIKLYVASQEIERRSLIVSEVKGIQHFIQRWFGLTSNILRYFTKNKAYC
jgi:hypothetical protein